MKSAKVILAASLCSFLLGCADYTEGEQRSAARDESREGPNFGSATDIVPRDSTGVDTNAPNEADIGIGGAPQRRSGNFQGQPYPSQTSDEELAKKIKVALTTGSMGTTGAIAEDQLTRIEVRVQDGVVTLSGPVSSEHEKRTIEQQVAGMKGIKSVRNALQVTQREPNNAIDAVVPRSPGNR